MTRSAVWLLCAGLIANATLVEAGGLPADRAAPGSFPFPEAAIPRPPTPRTDRPGEADSLPSAPSAADMKLTLLGGFKPGDRFRVETTDHRVQEGELVGSNLDTLLLSGARGEARIPFSSVQRLWIRGRSVGGYAKGGAIVGGILGGVLFGLLAPVASQMGDGDPTGPFTTGDEIKAILLGGGLGCVSLGVAGGIVGAAVPAWHLRYRSCPDVQPVDARWGSSGALRSDSLGLSTEVEGTGTNPPRGTAPAGSTAPTGGTTGNQAGRRSFGGRPARSDRGVIELDRGVQPAPESPPSP
jgi:hypothetical protein